MYAIQINSTGEWVVGSSRIHFTYSINEARIFDTIEDAEAKAIKYGLHYIHKYTVVPVKEVIINDKRTIHVCD